METIHIGKIIEQKVKERKLTVVEFAAAIGHSRDYVYSIFHKQSIDIELLRLISKTLNYNFLSEVYLNRQAIKKHFVLLELTEQQFQELLHNPAYKIHNVSEFSDTFVGI
jgi:hypothetical protein